MATDEQRAAADAIWAQRPSTKLDAFRAKYPGAYDNVDDKTLADALYKKFYSNLPRDQFDRSVGLTPSDSSNSNVPEFDPGVEGYDPKTGLVTKDTGAGATTGAYLTGAVEGLPVVGPTALAGTEWAAANLIKATGGGGDRTAEDLQRDMRSQVAQVQQDNPTAATLGKVTGMVGGSLAAGGAGSAALRAAAPATVSTALPWQIFTSGVGNMGLTAADDISRGVGGEELGRDVTLSGLIGGAAPGLGAAVTGGIKFAGDIFGDIGGFFRPSQVADKRIARTIGQDFKAGQNLVQNPAQESAVLATRGNEVINLDRFGNQTRGLAGDAASKAGLPNDILDIRQAGQKGRIVADLESMVGGAANRTAVKDAIKSGARAANDPMYLRAEMMPAAQSMWTPRLQQLTASSSVQAAIRKAEETAGEVAAAAGHPPPVHPFVEGADGILRPRPGMTPNLKFWDQVYKNLSDIKDKAWESGSNQKQVVSDVFKGLQKEIDTIVPEYKQARGVASEFFKAGNAVDSGTELVRGNYANMEELARNSAKWMPWEREGIAVGAVGELIEGAEKAADPVKYLSNPALHRKLTVGLGAQKAQQILDLAAVESLLAKAPKAVGQAGSKWPGRLGDATMYGASPAAGLAYGASTGDWRSAVLFAAGGAAGRGMQKAGSLKIAEEIAAKLVSNDPNAMKEVLKIVSRDRHHRTVAVLLGEGLKKSMQASANAAAQFEGNQPGGNQ
jgi:hypothetical protein